MEMGSHQFIDVSQVFSKYYYFLLKDLKSNGCREKKMQFGSFSLLLSWEDCYNGSWMTGVIACIFNIILINFKF